MSDSQPKHYDNAAEVEVRSLPPRGESIGAWCALGEPGPSTGNQQTLTWVLSGERGGVIFPGARDIDSPAVHLSFDLDGQTPRRFDAFEPEPFSLLSFSGKSAGEARVFVGTLFGQESPIETPRPLVGAELRIYPGAEFVFMVDPELEYGVLALDEGLHLENIPLDTATVGVTHKGTKTLHIVNTSDRTARAIVLGGS